MVGARIRDIRKGGGYSLAEVAAEAGISAATLSRIETGRQQLDVELLIKLAEVLGVPPQALVNGDGDGDSASIAREVHALRAPRRTSLWRNLMGDSRRSDTMTEEELAVCIDALLAQVELVRCQLEAVRSRLKKS